MNKKLEKPGKVELNAWTKKHLNAAVKSFMKMGDINSVMIEAKPAWVLPFQILIGKIRVNDSSGEFVWFICGEVPTDYLDSAIATAPRDAAKHFSMRWQLAAVRHEQKIELNLDASTQKSQQEDRAAKLIEQAETLYDLVQDDRLWLQQINS